MKKVFWILGVIAFSLMLFLGRAFFLPSPSSVAGENGAQADGNFKAGDKNFISEKALGVPGSSEGGERKQVGSGILALRVFGEGGGALRGISVKFLHLETLEEGEGWTDGKGELRVFSEGGYLFQLAGKGYVRELLPPVKVGKLEGAIRKGETEKPKMVRLKKGGELRVQLLRFSDGAPFRKSEALLFLPSFGGEKQVSIHWRALSFFSSTPFLSFAKRFLLLGEKHEMDRKGFQALLRSFKERTGVRENAWLPYLDQVFLVSKPDQNGIVSWKGLPDLPVRWGLKKREFSLQPNPPFEGKEIKAIEREDGHKTFFFLGRKPKDLSGLIHVLPGQVKFFKARVFTENGVVVSIPKPKHWVFGESPSILTVMEKSGDRYHGGAMASWGVERMGKLVHGRYVFENLSVGKEKRITCFVHNPEKTEFSFLQSENFLFPGGRMDLGSLHPMAGGDVRLRVVVDGGLEKAKKILPLKFSLNIQGVELIKDVFLGSKPLVFHGVRGKTISITYPSGIGGFFHNEKEGENWKFVKRGPLDVLPGGPFLSNAGSDLVIHLAPLHRVKVPFSVKIVEGAWLKGAGKQLDVKSFPSFFSVTFDPSFQGVHETSSPMSGFFVEDGDQPHRLAVARLRLYPTSESDENEARVFRGYSLSQTPPIFIPLKQCFYVQFIGLKKPDKFGTFSLQPKELFENPLARKHEALRTTLIKRGKVYVTFNRIPLPGDFVIWENTPEKGDVVLKTLRIEKGTTKVDLR